MKANAQEFKPAGGSVEAVKDGKTLFVGNLPWSVEWSELKDYLASEGHVASGEILNDYQGRSKGFAIVQMASVAEAKKVIGMVSFLSHPLSHYPLSFPPAALNGIEFHGRDLEIRFDKGPSSKKAAVAVAAAAPEPVRSPSFFLYLTLLNSIYRR